MRRTFGALVGTVKDAFPSALVGGRGSRGSQSGSRSGSLELRTQEGAPLGQYVRTGTQLRGCEPEGRRGRTRGRIRDGEARVPWFTAHGGVRDGDFANGQELLEAVVEAFVHGKREGLSGTRRAAALTSGRDSMPEKVARFAGVHRRRSRRVKSGDRRESSDRARARSRHARGKLRSAFGSLPLAYIGKVLREASGEGVGPRTAAAELSVRANAMDTWKVNVSSSVSSWMTSKTESRRLGRAQERASVKHRAHRPSRPEWLSRGPSRAQAE